MRMTGGTAGADQGIARRRPSRAADGRCRPRRGRHKDRHKDRHSRLSHRIRRRRRRRRHRRHRPLLLAGASLALRRRRTPTSSPHGSRRLRSRLTLRRLIPRRLSVRSHRSQRSRRVRPVRPAVRSSAGASETRASETRASETGSKAAGGTAPAAATTGPGRRSPRGRGICHRRTAGGARRPTPRRRRRSCLRPDIRSRPIQVLTSIRRRRLPRGAARTTAGSSRTAERTTPGSSTSPAPPDASPAPSRKPAPGRTSRAPAR